MASSRGRWASPERTMVWTEPPPHKTTTRRTAAAPSTKVPVVYYYLSRNGQLDHPHFMEVPLSSPQDGLRLRDVLDRLAALRGAGMADAYSWSSKRSYKSGYVWHDLAADDPVHPANGSEYVLKGFELLPAPIYPRDASTGSSSSSSSSCQAGNENNKKTPHAGGSRAHGRRKNWSSFELGEYRVAAAHLSELDNCAILLSPRSTSMAKDRDADDDEMRRRPPAQGKERRGDLVEEDDVGARGGRRACSGGVAASVHEHD